jgi:hypothetical protein
VEDLTLWTKSDPYNRLSVSPTAVTATALSAVAGEQTWLYRPVSFSGDFLIKCKQTVLAVESRMGISLSNHIMTFKDERLIYGYPTASIYYSAGAWKLYVTYNGGGLYKTHTEPVGSTRWLTFQRTGTTHALLIYSDPARANLVASLSGYAPVDSYAYAYALRAHGDAIVGSSFEIADVDLGIPPLSAGSSALYRNPYAIYAGGIA